jgi:hypothetical protein
MGWHRGICTCKAIIQARETVMSCNPTKQVVATISATLHRPQGEAETPRVLERSRTCVERARKIFL